MTRRHPCRCLLCQPHPGLPGELREVVHHVRLQGYAVLAVGAGGCECGDCDGEPSPEDEGPAFAYTIGLPHSAGHPELVVSGLDVEVMRGMLHEAARRVLAGFRFRPGTTAENLIGFWPVVADPMSAEGLAETVLWSEDFHRGEVPALQLVWPSTSGVFHWQPGGSASVAAAQPDTWRLPQERVGALAPDPDWPYPVPADHLVFTCRHVAQEGAPVLAVVRLQGPAGADLWLFDCPLFDDHADDDLCAYHFAHLARGVPSLRELADLRPGEEAVRASCWSPWVRGQALAA